MSQLFAVNCIFGLSSKNDTSNQLNSAGFDSCYQAGFISEGSTWTLTNVICEGSLRKAKDLTDTQKSIFDGHGFVFYDTRANLYGCYTEWLFGQSRYIENGNIIDLNGILTNTINWYINGESTADADLKAWLIANRSTHMLENIYIHTTSGKNTVATFNSNFYANTISTELKNVARVQNDNYTNSYNNYDLNIIFKGVVAYQGVSNTFQNFYNGNVKPIVEIFSNNQERGFKSQNADIIPTELYGVSPSIKVADNSDNELIELSKHKSFSDTTYDEISFKSQITASGTTHVYLVKRLAGVQVSSTDIMQITPAGVVSFPAS